jgi:hypothetical protein
MTEQVTHNCHYVSRFLTTPWEEGQRLLRFYDFDEDAFHLRSSRTLLTGEDINSPTVETWLQRFIEDPIGNIRARLARGEVEQLENNWACFRAAMLILWLQGVRMRTLDDHDARRHLDALAALSEPAINGLVTEMMRSYNLRLYQTLWNGSSFAPLCVPSSGMYRFTFPDTGCQSGHSIGVGIPIDLHCALVATPAENHGQLDLSRIPGSLANCSVGTSEARRVVIMPLLYQQQGEDSLRTILKELRATNDFLITAVVENRSLVVDMYAESGIEVGRDGAGRIPPNRGRGYQ